MILLLVAAVYFFSCEAFADEDGPSKLRNLSDISNLLSSEKGIEEIFKEFEEIPGGKRRPWTIAESPGNIKKNRYKELLPFDHSRVVLKRSPDEPFSDYINANYIDGQNSLHEYIATQGPLSNTVKDFWRMIMEHNSTKIIMLANLMEKGEPKVEKYWPDTSEIYGDIAVSKISEYTIPHLQHTIRTFSIRQTGNENPYFVKQFHFTGWPDLGVPSNRLPVISIIHQARLYDPNSKAPIIVHCSAGVGRTGTLILMDSMIQKAKMEGSVDFLKRLNHMRTLRPDVVEKKEQYLFAYEAVNDVFNVNGIQEQLEEVEKKYQRLGKNSWIQVYPTPYIQV